jgi:hypothetical protein
MCYVSDRGVGRTAGEGECYVIITSGGPLGPLYDSLDVMMAVGRVLNFIVTCLS